MAARRRLICAVLCASNLVVLSNLDGGPRLKVTLVQGASVDKRYRPQDGTVEEPESKAELARMVASGRALVYDSNIECVFIPPKGVRVHTLRELRAFDSDPFLDQILEARPLTRARRP